MRDPADAAEEALGPSGRLARVLPRYEYRPQQIALSRHVAAALAERRFLLAEAGTGTGKTLAYLVPAVLSGRKVVVATATKNLEDQIFFKDIPLVRQALDADFGATLMKGRQNYLCALRFERFDAAPRFDSDDEAMRWPAIREWAGRTETGDRAEIDLPDEFSAWSELSTPSRACPGVACPRHSACFITRMRERARAADLLVVNHHLFFADLAVRAGAGAARGAEVIPQYDAVVFDEAHALEEVATAFFAVTVSPLRVAELRRDAAALVRPDDERFGGSGALLDKCEHLAGELFRAVAAVTSPGGERAARLSRRAFEQEASRFDDLAVALDAVRGLLAGSQDPAVKALARRAGDLHDDLAFVRRADEPGYVYWAETRARAVFLKAAPIDVARELRDRLYAKIDTAIFTSATLTVEGRFDYARARLGLDASGSLVSRPVDEVAVGSPFDYGRQAAIYLAPQMPDPSSPDFVPAACEQIAHLCALTGGRALVLFTSLRNMAAAHTALSARLPWPALVQGERPKHRLLEAFREQPSVLFASHSFWEGVDVPGEALSLVVIDKLPFASPGDPVVAARVDWLRDQDRDPFAEYQLPAAVLALRQGFGRLVRTSSDRGVVALLDPRLMSRAYGRSFLTSLPACPRFADFGELERWWRREEPFPD